MINYNGMSPNEAASALLTKHKGNARNAEVEAWEEQKQYPEQESAPFKYFGDVVLAIVYKREFPAVERVQHTAATFASGL